MKNMMKTMFLAAAMAAALFGQGYSNPVREVEKPGRSAVFGVCSTDISVGYSGNTLECHMTDLDQPLGVTVPAGKVLVIEDVSSNCGKNSTDTLAAVALVTTGYNKILPMKLEVTYPGGAQQWVSSMPMRTYVKPGGKVFLSVSTTANANAAVHCNARFSGHLENAQ